MITAIDVRGPWPVAIIDRGLWAWTLVGMTVAEALELVGLPVS